MNSSHKWARLFSKIDLNGTFLKLSSILCCFVGSEVINELGFNNWH